MNDQKTIDQLVLNNDGLLHTVAQKYHIDTSRYDYPDIISDLRIVMIEKAQTYDLSKGKFVSYCYLWLRRRILQLIGEHNLIRYKSIETYNSAKYGLGYGKQAGKIQKNKERLHSQIDLDALQKDSHNNPSDTITNHDRFLTVDFNYGTLNDLPNYLNEALEPIEKDFLIQCYSPKDKNKMMALLRQLGVKEYTVHYNYPVKKEKYRILSKLVKYYRSKGIRLKMPTHYNEHKYNLRKLRK